MRQWLLINFGKVSYTKSFFGLCLIRDLLLALVFSTSNWSVGVTLPSYTYILHLQDVLSKLVGLAKTRITIRNAACYWICIRYPSASIFRLSSRWWNVSGFWAPVLILCFLLYSTTITLATCNVIPFAGTHTDYGCGYVIDTLHRSHILILLALDGEYDDRLEAESEDYDDNEEVRI